MPRALSQPCCGSLGAWQPPHTATLTLPCVPAKLQPQIFPESLRKPGMATCQTQPVLAVQHCCIMAKGTMAGLPTSLPMVMSQPGWDCLVAHGSPGTAHHSAQCGLPVPEAASRGCFQESMASPVPSWFYTPRGRDNVRKLPERGMWPEVLGQRGLRPEISYSRTESSDNSECPGCL